MRQWTDKYVYIRTIICLSNMMHVYIYFYVGLYIISYSNGVQICYGFYHCLKSAIVDYLYRVYTLCNRTSSELVKSNFSKVNTYKNIPVLVVGCAFKEKVQCLSTREITHIRSESKQSVWTSAVRHQTKLPLIWLIKFPFPSRLPQPRPPQTNNLPSSYHTSTTPDPQPWVLPPPHVGFIFSLSTWGVLFRGRERHLPWNTNEMRAVSGFAQWWSKSVYLFGKGLDRTWYKLRHDCG